MPTDRLERVGGEVVLEGVQRFKQDAEATRQSLDKINQSTDSLASKTSRAWPGIASAVAAGASVANLALQALQRTAEITAQALVGIGADVQSSFLSLAAAAEKPVESLGALQDVIFQVASKSPLGLQRVTDAADQLVRAGISIEDVMGGVLQAVNDFYIASGREVKMEQGILTVSAALNAFGLHGKDAARVVDTLTAAAIRSAITFTDLDRSFRQSAAISAMLGFTVEDLGTALGVLGGEALRSSDAGTSLRQMFISLMSPTIKANTMMQMYGVSLYNSQGNVKGLRDIVASLVAVFGDEARKVSGMTEAQRDYALATIFGSDSVRAAIALIKSGLPAWDAMRASINSLTAAQVAQHMIQDNLSAQSKIFLSDLQVLAASFSLEFIPALAKSVAGISALIRSMSLTQVKAFGDIVKTAFTGEGLDELQTKLAATFGPAGASILQSFAKLLITIRNVIVQDFVPGVVALWKAFTTNGVVLNAIVILVNALKDGLVVAGQVFLGTAAIISNLTRMLLSNAVAVKILTDAFLIFMGIKIASSLIASLLVIGGACKAVFLSIKALTLGVYALATGALSKLDDTLTVTEVYFIVFSRELGGAILKVIAFGLTLVAQGVKALGVFIAALTQAIAAVLTFAINMTIAAIKAVAGWVAAIPKLVASLVVAAAAFITSAEVALQAAMIWANAAIEAIAEWISNIPKLVASLGYAAASFLLSAVSAAEAAVIWVASGIKAIAAWVGQIPKFVASIGIAIAAFAASAVAAGKAALAWAAAAIAAIGGWIKQIPALIVSLGRLGLAFVVSAGKAVAAAAAMVFHAIIAIPQLIKAIPQAIVSIGLMAKAFASQAAAAIAAAAASIAAAASGGSLVPILIAIAAVLAVIALLVFGLYEAWTHDFLKMRTSALGAWEAVKQLALGLLGLQSMDDLNKMLADLATQQADAAQEAKDLAAGLSGVNDVGFAEVGVAQLMSNALEVLLQDLPQVTDELTAYLLTLKTVTPLNMVAVTQAIKDQGATLNAMTYSARDLAGTELELLNIAEQQAAVQQAQAALSLREKEATRQYELEVISLQNQQYSLNQQLVPLKLAVAAIDHEINQVNKSTVDLDRQALDIQVAMAPYLERIAILDQKIADVVDQRLTLEREEMGLLAEQAQIQADLALKQTTADLNNAWATMNVPEILRLEALKELQTKEKDAADTNAEKIRNETRLIEIQNRLKQLPYEMEKAAIEASLLPMQRRLEAVQREKDLRSIMNEEILAGLNSEKQALEDQMYPIQQQIDAVGEAITVEQHNIDVIKQSFSDEAYALEVASAQLSLYQGQVEATRAAQAKAHAELIMGYVNALVASGHFSYAEAVETVKRMGLWDDQAAKWVDIRVKIDEANDAVLKVTKSLALMPKAIGATFTWNLAFDPNNPINKPNEGQIPAVPGAFTGYAQGGVVPGPYGLPQLAVVHGGERYLGIGQVKPAVVQAAESANVYNQQQRNITNVTTYDVKPTYEAVQAPVTLAMDLRALIALAKR